MARLPPVRRTHCAVRHSMNSRLRLLGKRAGRGQRPAHNFQKRYPTGVHGLGLASLPPPLTRVALSRRPYDPCSFRGILIWNTSSLMAAAPTTLPRLSGNTQRGLRIGWVNLMRANLLPWLMGSLWPQGRHVPGSIQTISSLATRSKSSRGLSVQATRMSCLETSTSLMNLATTSAKEG